MDSVLQTRLTRAESASAQLDLASCARFLIVEPTEKALNSSKSREKNAEEFVK